LADELGIDSQKDL